MTLSMDEWSVLDWILACLGVGFVVFTVFCSVFRGPGCRFGDERDLIAEGVVLSLVWPMSVPCFAAVGVWALVLALLDWMRSRKSLRWLPDWDDCHPLDWVFCWPGNIARYIERKMRERISRQKHPKEDTL